MASRIVPYKRNSKQCFVHSYYREYNLYGERYTVLIAAIFDENGCLYSRKFSDKLNISPQQAQSAVERFCEICTCYEDFSDAFEQCCTGFEQCCTGI